MRQPLASIIVPVYNARKTLEKCVVSLLDLNFERERYEIILVNDCSTDGSAAIANEFAALHPNIIVINLKERSGVNAARNQGILSANGEIIVFTDSDCVVDPQWLKALIDRLDKADVGGVHGKTLPSSPSKSILFRVDAPVSTSGFFHETCNIAYRKDVLLSVGLLDENFSCPPDIYHRGDSDLAFRVEDRGVRIVYEPQAIVFHPIKKVKIARFGLKYRYDALLYKKHPKRARELLGVKRGFITTNGIAFSTATLSLLLLVAAFNFGHILSQILSIAFIILEYLIVFLKYYRDRSLVGLISPIVLYTYLFFCQINRIYGSLKYKKLIF